jgi:hypothetical protein
MKMIAMSNRVVLSFCSDLITTPPYPLMPLRKVRKILFPGKGRERTFCARGSRLPRLLEYLRSTFKETIMPLSGWEA